LTLADRPDSIGSITQEDRMKAELTLSDGRRWAKLTDESDARLANAMSKTLIGSVFDAERRYNEPLDGGSRKGEFFLLLTPRRRRADVAVKVAYNGKLSSGGMVPKGSLVTGYANQDPYPDHAAAIEALSKHVGVPLPREAYPYRDARPAGYVILPKDDASEQSVPPVP
jgi:hypothetical protein